MSFAESDLFHAASAEFPEMYAVSLSPSLTDSDTVVTVSPVNPSVGDSITVTAETFEKNNPSNKASNPSYLIYTYDVTNNVRLETCYASGCTLEFTSNTTFVKAEFLGDNTFKPSIGSWQMNNPGGRGVTLNLSNLEPIVTP